MPMTGTSAYTIHSPSSAPALCWMFSAFSASKLSASTEIQWKQPSSASAREEEMAAVIFTEKVWMAKVMPLALMPDLYWPYSAQSGVNMKARMPTMLMGMVRMQVSVRNSARFS